MENIKIRFGVAIRRRRKELGFSQKELAQLSGLNRTNLSHLEQGMRNVSLESTEKLAKALEIPISILFADYDIDYDVAPLTPVPDHLRRSTRFTGAHAEAPQSLSASAPPVSQQAKLLSP